MKRLLILAILFVGLVGAISINAQTNLNRKYRYEVKNGENSHEFLLTFERQDAVYYSYAYIGKGYGTIGGKWTLENGIIKAVLTRGDENWTLKLKQKGDDLEIAETLPEKGLADIPDFKTILPAGTIFKKDVSKPTGPDLPAAEVGKRVIKLVKSIRTLKDFSPENIELQTGVKVSFYDEKRSKYGFGGKTAGAPDWTYGFSAYPHPLGKTNNVTGTLSFSFNYQLHEPDYPEMPKVFKDFNLVMLVKELQKVGFSAPTPNIGEHGRLLGWYFTREKVLVNVSAKGSSTKSNRTPNKDNYIERIIVSMKD